MGSRPSLLRGIQIDVIIYMLVILEYTRPRAFPPEIWDRIKDL
jgi:hypothetical protein